MTFKSFYPKIELKLKDIFSYQIKKFEILNKIIKSIF